MLLRATARRLGAESSAIRRVANAADTSAERAAAYTAEPHDEQLHGRDAQLVRSILRVDLVAQQAAAALFSGQVKVQPAAPDVAGFRDAERQQLQRVQLLAPQHRVRPSLLGPMASAAFAVLGAAAALAPRRARDAVAAGVQDALTDTYNEQLRALRERGLADVVPEVRQLVRGLRDQERAPDGAPHAPDISALGRGSGLTPAESLAAVVKAGTAALLSAAQKV